MEQQGTQQRRARSRTVEELASALALLLASGLTLSDALQVVRTVFPRGAVERLAARLLLELERGRTVVQAVEGCGAGFPPLFAGWVRIGDRVGSLEGSFRRIADYMARRRRLRERLVGALTYPAIVMAVALAGLVGLAFGVMPQLEGLFRQLGASVPSFLARRAALARAGLQALLAAAMVLAGTLPLGAWARRARGSVALALDRIALRLPGLAAVVRHRESSAFVFAMETLVAGGFAVEEAMAEAAAVVGNRVLRSGVLRARGRVVKGEPLSRALAAESGLPERLTRWVAISERSGAVQEVFRQLRQYYEGESEKWSERAAALAEPLLVVAVGAILLLFVLVFVVPLFSLYGGLL